MRQLDALGYGRITMEGVAEPVRRPARPGRPRQAGSVGRNRHSD